MAPKFRESEFIDFDTGTVKLAPIQLQFRMRMAGTLSLPDLVRLFACRIEVWQLGVAAQMIQAIEFNQPPEVWSHAAYAVLALLMPYFETVGKLVNPTGSTTAHDFVSGFRDVYPDVTTSAGASYDPREFYARTRHGFYALGSTPQGLWLHNERSISTRDFDVIQKNPADPATRKYYVNPHAVVRTVIDHFPTLIARLNDTAPEHDALRARFHQFFAGTGEEE